MSAGAGVSPARSMSRILVRRKAQLAGAAAAKGGTLQSKVYARLRHAMIGGLFVPGETVTLRRLAQLFGTSVMPVREAVTRLIAERALVLLPNRTVIVPRMTRSRFEDLSAARLMLEPYTTGLAAARVAKTDIRKLHAVNQRIIACVAASDRQKALAANRDFHFTLYAASGSEVLTHLIEGLWLQVGPFLVFSLDSPAARWTTAHHLALIQALEANDSPAAQDAIGEDIRETSRQLLEIGVFGEEPARPTKSVNGR